MFNFGPGPGQPSEFEEACAKSSLSYLKKVENRPSAELVPSKKSGPSRDKAEKYSFLAGPDLVLTFHSGQSFFRIKYRDQVASRFGIMSGLGTSFEQLWSPITYWL